MARDIEAVIFDMDGVLVDSEWLYIEKYAEFLTQQGYPATPQQMTFHAGAGPHRNYDEIKKRFGIPWDRDTYLDLLHEHMADMQLDYAKAMNTGVRELLQYLKARGYPTAVASASGLEAIGRILLACGIYEYFTVAISTGSVANTKPAPDVYLAAAARLGFAPARCLAIEDSPRGLAAAVAAGCVAVGKDDTRFGFDLSAATYRVPSLHEVIPLVQARGVHG